MVGQMRTLPLLASLVTAAWAQCGEVTAVYGGYGQGVAWSSPVTTVEGVLAYTGKTITIVNVLSDLLNGKYVSLDVGSSGTSWPGDSVGNWDLQIDYSVASGSANLYVWIQNGWDPGLTTALAAAGWTSVSPGSMGRDTGTTITNDLTLYQKEFTTGTSTTVTGLNGRLKGGVFSAAVCSASTATTATTTSTFTTTSTITTFTSTATTRTLTTTSTITSKTTTSTLPPGVTSTTTTATTATKTTSTKTTSTKITSTTITSTLTTSKTTTSTLPGQPTNTKTTTTATTTSMTATATSTATATTVTATATTSTMTTTVTSVTATSTSTITATSTTTTRHEVAIFRGVLNLYVNDPAALQSAHQSSPKVEQALQEGIASGLPGISSTDVTILSVRANRRLQGASPSAASRVIVDYEITVERKVMTQHDLTPQKIVSKETELLTSISPLVTAAAPQVTVQSIKVIEPGFEIQWNDATSTMTTTATVTTTTVEEEAFPIFTTLAIGAAAVLLVGILTCAILTLYRSSARNNARSKREEPKEDEGVIEVGVEDNAVKAEDNVEMNVVAGDNSAGLVANATAPDDAHRLCRDQSWGEIEV